MKERVRTVLILDEAVAFGGSIVSTANLIRALDPTRYVAVFCTGADVDIAKHRLHEASAKTPVVRSWKLVTYATELRWSGYRSRIQSRVIQQLATLVIYGTRVILNVPYMMQVVWLTLRHRVDLVQFNNGFGNDEAALVAMLLRRRTVAFFRGYIPLGSVMRTLFLSRIRGYVAVSEHAKGMAVQDGVPESLITVATPPAIAIEAVEGEREQTRRLLGLSHSAVVIGFFGRIVPWKGQLEFVRAVAEVVRRIPNARVLFVGDSSDGPAEYEQIVRKAVEDYGLGPHVIFTGYVDNVDKYYRAIDVVSHGSIEPEPSGRVIFEAMNHGLPIVASNLGGPREFIDHAVDGFLVDPTDTKLVANTLVQLLEDPELRDKIGKRARWKIENVYGPSGYAAKVMNRYDLCFKN